MLETQAESAKVEGGLSKQTKSKLGDSKSSIKSNITSFRNNQWIKVLSCGRSLKHVAKNGTSAVFTGFQIGYYSAL